MNNTLISLAAGFVLVPLSFGVLMAQQTSLTVSPEPSGGPPDGVGSAAVEAESAGEREEVEALLKRMQLGTAAERDLAEQQLIELGAAALAPLRLRLASIHRKSYVRGPNRVRKQLRRRWPRRP